MDLQLLFYIAGKHLFSRLKQSLVAALGVTIGIGMFITLSTFMTGLNGLLDGLSLDRTPHIHLYKEIGPSERQPLAFSAAYADDLLLIHSIKPKRRQSRIASATSMIKSIRSYPEVRGVSPHVRSQVFYSAGAVDLNGVVSGIDVAEEVRLFPLEDYIVAGSTDALKRDENAIILGHGVARKLSTDIDGRVQLLSTEGNRLPLKVVGLYQSGLADVDDTQSYVNIGTARRLLGERTGYVTDINVKLYDIENALPLAEHFASLYNIKAVDIGTANAQFETGTSIRNLITYVVSITLLVVAGFGIYNILNMFIREKMNDIAILKAIGFSGREVKMIFMIQALAIGLFGGVMGLLLGWGLSVLIDHTPFEMEALPTITTYPVNIAPIYFVIGFAFAVVASYFAGYLPANKARKMDPVDVLRGQ
ncbi:ABC transporter permease [Neolewinella antarctica]|uniref:Lipoprotein-releasing system permease protein n=1 Tax=Neolewinella antarctica TaxID=442734 RepID=A0ABX0X8L6_9BACT|nr:FtsX-like permease family protein [Neolewinella antarctica]NJC25598.1 lipoprotein-releasing system permease protein [Neolewinella antarctica]